MRRIAAAACLLLPLLAGGCAEVNTTEVVSLPPQKAAEESVMLRALIDPASEVRGVFIASVYNIDFPTKPDLSEKALRAELDSILDTMETAGLNTVYFQVRPAADALYDSEIFPVSQALFTDGVLHFDPLAYLVEEAHARNMFVHAWVNPLRASVGSEAKPNTDPAAQPQGSPAREHPEWTVAYSDGRLYLDPGIPQVRRLIADGAREIVEKYSVDGIIFDDYFYPYPVTDAAGVTQAFRDDVSYAAYGGGRDRADWRRENINEMVRQTYEAIKSADEDVLFGVAPFGIWKNDDGQNGGSATRGLQSYYSIFCDSLAWAQGGYVDYLAPQIYWRFSTEVAPYGELVRWWNKMLDGTGVDLLVSHAAYQYDAWSSPEGEMAQQVQFARSELTYKGSIFYGYDEIRRDAFSLGQELARVYEEEIIYTSPSPTGEPPHVSSPPFGTYVDAASTYLIGSSSPDKPLLVNGEPVSRTRGGYFSLYADLKKGENAFVFEQDGQKYIHIIHRGTPEKAESSSGTGQAVMTDFAITDVSPASDVMREGGGALTLSCTAPAGADVTAVLGDMTVTLKQVKRAEKVESGYAAVRYTGTVDLPRAASDELLPLGEVQFNCRLGEKQAQAYGARITVRGANARLPVRVLEDHTELKLGASSYYYDDFSVQSAGMTDYATWQGGGMYLLRVGGYVYEDSVEVLREDTRIPTAKIGSAEIAADAENTYIRFALDQNVPHNGTVRDGAFELTLYNVDVKSVPAEIPLAENPLIESVKVTYPNKANCVRLICKLYDTENFYGFDFAYTEDGAQAILRNPRKIDLSSEKPLEGIRIVLDAGHGGADTGALGPLATGQMAVHEADINLSVTLAAKAELEKLGASVLLTRDADVTVDIYDRVEYLCEEMPDLAISIHQNSLGYSSDITGVRGTLGLWWADSGVLLAHCLSDSTAWALHRREMTPAQQRLALCRNPKFPSALLEVGFITSVEEYEYMLSGGDRHAGQGIAEGVLAYFAEQQKWIK